MEAVRLEVSGALIEGMRISRLKNRAAYVPPQCFTRTREEDGRPRNPCYVCHTAAQPPNYQSDSDLQLRLTLPVAASPNRWTNLFVPPSPSSPRPSNDEVLRRVRESNYFDADGDITLARVLADLPANWDGNGNGVWDGYVPDVWFRFDERGFDRRRDGTYSGWRAFAYYPFPGTFFPTNGSTDDMLIRLDSRLQEDSHGNFEPSIYEINLAIVEALVTRSDVPIAEVDENELGVDLDLDGRLETATKVVFDGARDGATRMRYVGRAGLAQAAGEFPIAPGLFPVGTEFLHTVRYLDVADDGAVGLAARMKEVRYARKNEWLSYKRLAVHAADDALERAQSPDGARDVPWGREAGIPNGQGWVFQAFIEDRDGALRPQWYEEMAACVGCHGGIGATTDSIFSFPRKLPPSAVAGGWFHWSQHGLNGIHEPRTADGHYEYARYLAEAGAGDELRENEEVIARFFDPRGELREGELASLHDDIARLLLPTPQRALDLDRAYEVLVERQAYAAGRDAVLRPSLHVLRSVTLGGSTGISSPDRSRSTPTLTGAASDAGLAQGPRPPPLQRRARQTRAGSRRCRATAPTPSPRGSRPGNPRRR